MDTGTKQTEQIVETRMDEQGSLLWHPSLVERITTFDRACERTASARRDGKRVVFTSGTFDILHAAHFHYLMHLKMKGDLLVVCIENNEAVRERKGSGHPFFDEMERAVMIANLRYVDLAYIDSGAGRWEVEDLLKLMPHFVGVPPFDPEMKSKREKIELAGSQIVVTPPFLRGYSSSKAAKMLD